MNVRVIDDEVGRTVNEIISRDAALQGDTIGQVTPSIVQNVKFDNKGQMSSLTSNCGETENRREGDNKPSLTVDGIIGESEIDEMRALKFQDTISFVSDVYRGDVIVKRLSIEQSADLLSIKPNSGEEELAFTFQLQLEEP